MAGNVFLTALACPNKSGQAWAWMPQHMNMTICPGALESNPAAPSAQEARMSKRVSVLSIVQHAWMHGCMDVQVHGSMDAWMYGRMDVWMYGCPDACMDVWMH